MENKIELEKVDNYSYNLVALNGKRFAQIKMQEDGYFIFDGKESWVLREIADRLDEVNAPFNKIIQDYFKNSPCKDERDGNYGCLRSGDFVCEDCENINNKNK